MTYRIKLVVYSKKLKWRIYKTKANFRKYKRLLFPSPAEVEFIRIFGGKFITFSHIKNPFTKFPLTFITSLGVILERENIQREVRAGAMYVDFGQTTKYGNKGIEIDGKNFHRDIIKELKRDEYLKNYGWQLLHIQAEIIYREPKLVQNAVIKFLA